MKRDEGIFSSEASLKGCEMSILQSTRLLIMNKLPMRVAMGFLLVIFCFISEVLAQPINIDFGVNLSASVPPATYGAASNQAGAWNVVGLGTTSNLLRPYGVPSTVSINVDALSDTGFSGGGPGNNDNEALLKDNFFSQESAWSVTLNGLVDGAYDLYIYEQSHHNVQTGDMLINGTPVWSIPGSRVSNLIEGTSYLVVQQVMVSGGTLSLVRTDTSSFAGLAGLQLVLPILEAIQQLIEEVLTINLQQGILNSLDAKLDSALKVLDDVNVKNYVAAINLLEAFINAVEAQSGRNLTIEEADALIDLATQLIDLLEII